MGSTRIPAFAHNMIAVRAASAGGLTPGEITFTAVLSLIRAAITSDTCCPRCHKRPTRANAPASALGAAIAAPPRRPPADLRTHPPLQDARRRADQPTTPSPSSRQISRKRTQVLGVKAVVRPRARGLGVVPR